MNTVGERRRPQFGPKDRMRLAREIAGLTSQEMAARLDVTRNTVTNYEKGHTTPTKATRIAWAMTTGVDLGAHPPRRRHAPPVRLTP